MSFDLERVRAALPGRDVHWHDSIPTTMKEASRLAAGRCASGTTVGADEQTAGLGRLGRRWHSEKGSGLYFSVVLRPAFAIESFPALTLAVGLAVRRAIEETTQLTCDLRWPNDLLLGERKCAGILIQAEGDAIIAGVGINVNHADFPEELAAIATSLRAAAGRTFEREMLLVAALRAIDDWCGTIASRGIQPVLDAFAAASSYVNGRRVRAEAGSEGVTAGLDPQGFLLLRQNNGEVIKILAGGVRTI